MYKMPVGIKVTIFLLLVGLQVGIFNMILFFRESNLYFNKIEFEIMFTVISIIGMLIGMFFINIFRAWSPEMLAERMENVVEINNLIIKLQERKYTLKSDLLLDSIQVIVKGYDAGNGRIIKK